MWHCLPVTATWECLDSDTGPDDTPPHHSIDIWGVHMLWNICVCIDVCMCIHACICTYICIWMYVCECMFIYVHYNVLYVLIVSVLWILTFEQWMVIWSYWYIWLTDGLYIDEKHHTGNHNYPSYVLCLLLQRNDSSALPHMKQRLYYKAILIHRQQSEKYIGGHICICVCIRHYVNCWKMHFTIFQLLTQCQHDVKCHKEYVDSPSNVNIFSQYWNQ